MQLWWVRWDPGPLIPTATDRAAGDRLVDELRSFDGRVWCSSPTYLLERAGRPTNAQVMPLMDVGNGRGPLERGLMAQLQDSLAVHAWDMILLDNVDGLSGPSNAAGYRLIAQVRGQRGTFWTVTGMRVRPEFLVGSPEFRARVAARPR
jgi:hypothetical protein